VVPPARDVEFARTAAGFNNETGGARLSVMGGALVAATFAGGGEQPAVRIVAAIDGVPIAPPPSKRVLAAETAQAVAKMMEQTCSDGSATKTFGRSNTKVAGKTGTLTKTKRLRSRPEARDRRLRAAREPRELAPARPRGGAPPDRSLLQACQRA
jgi:membrane peptidoglycan carboxypeptidase